MKIKDEVVFLIGMRRKIVASGVPASKVNELFMDIFTANEMASLVSKDAIDIVCVMFEIDMPDKKPVVNVTQKEIKSATKSTPVADPCIRGFSGRRNDGC